MDIKKAIELIEKHNAWRRGDVDLEMTDPTELGIAIDIIADKFKKLNLANINNSLPDNYWFSDENGSIANLIGQTEEWCIMQNDGEEDLYVLPTVYVLSIYKEGVLEGKLR